jgi:hypothetical protein
MCEVHYILNEIGQIYHGENGQPLTGHGLIVTICEFTNS